MHLFHNLSDRIVDWLQMLWSGRVYDSNDQSADTVALRELAAKIHADQRVDVSFLTIGDGVVLAFKR